MARSKWCAEKSSHLVGSSRCLFGADDSERGFVGPKGIETEFGETMGVRNRHWSWHASIPQMSQQWAADAKAGAIPMISLGGQGYSEALVKQIVAGQFDGYWATLFDALAAAKTPGILRPWMEMNGSHNSYSADPAAFIAMWQRVRGLDASGLLTWVWCPQQYDPKMVWPAYWPGDALVDWFGLDLYRQPFVAADAWRAFANEHEKPFCIAESGFQQGVVVKTPAGDYDKDGSKTGNSLILDARTSVRAHPNCVMYLVWNCTGPVGVDYVDTSPLSLEQYKAFTTDTHFQFGGTR